MSKRALSPQFLYPTELSFSSEAKIKILGDKEVLRIFPHIKGLLQKIPRGRTQIRIKIN